MIFCAEILLYTGLTSEPLDGLDEDQLKVYLEELQNCYDEVLILSYKHRLLFCVSGPSQTEFVQIVGTIPYSQLLDLRAEDEALTLILEIAGGKHWRELSSRQFRKVFCQSINLSIDANCMGEVFSDIFIKVWDQSSRMNNTYAQLTELIRNPVFSSFKFQKYSLN